MLTDFELLVSSARGNEMEANSEVRYIVGELGDRNSIADRTNVSGLTVIQTNLEPISIIFNLRSLLKMKPWQFRYVLKIKPIEEVVESQLSNIEQAILNKVHKIADGETFRINVTKRRSDLSSKQIIGTVATNIKRKVDLEKPDKIILVEIVGAYTGISVIRDNDIFSVEKEKRLVQPSTFNRADRSMTSRFNASVLSSP